MRSPTGPHPSPAHTPAQASAATEGRGPYRLPRTVFSKYSVRQQSYLPVKVDHSYAFYRIRLTVRSATRRMPPGAASCAHLPAAAGRPARAPAYLPILPLPPSCLPASGTQQGEVESYDTFDPTPESSTLAVHVSTSRLLDAATPALVVGRSDSESVVVNGGSQPGAPSRRARGSEQCSGGRGALHWQWGTGRAAEQPCSCGCTGGLQRPTLPGLP